MGIDAKGQIVIVEIKVARSDLLGDSKWTEYLDYCDRFYWALPIGFDASPVDGAEFMPVRTGLIIADAYDAEIIRMGPETKLAGARRRVMTQKFARHAAVRAQAARDPSVGERYVLK